MSSSAALYARLIAGLPLGVTWRSSGPRGEQDFRRPRRADPGLTWGRRGENQLRESQDTYRYYILAYEDARHKQPIKHEYGGTTVLTDGADALGRAEVLAKEYPGGWVYIHVEYRGAKE